MPYLGNSPSSGGYHKLDSLTASATDTYALTLGGSAYYPATANQLMVSLNGVIQAPQDSFTISGSNIVFASALSASDSIDFIMSFGDVYNVGTPADGTITDAKIQSMAASKLTGALPAIDGSALTGVSAGKVLQVAYGELTTKVSITSSTFVDTGLTASITPASASNYLIVIPSVNLTINNNGSITQLDITDSSNNSIVNNTDTLGNRIKGIGQFSASASISGFISFHNYGFPMKIEPATTSAVTYKVRCRRDGATATINSTGTDSDSEWHIRPISTLTIFEIEG